MVCTIARHNNSLNGTKEILMKNEIKITERGWAGHYICSNRCNFRRNTLIEKGSKRIVVSTVGNYSSYPIKGIEKTERDNMIGHDRYYETMAFEAKKEGIYWEADVSKEISFNSEWAIGELKQETDQKANDMHEKVVEEIIKGL